MCVPKARLAAMSQFLRDANKHPLSPNKKTITDQSEDTIEVQLVDTVSQLELFIGKWGLVYLLGQKRLNAVVSPKALVSQNNLVES